MLQKIFIQFRILEIFKLTELPYKPARLLGFQVQIQCRINQLLIHQQRFLEIMYLEVILFNSSCKGFQELKVKWTKELRYLMCNFCLNLQLSFKIIKVIRFLLFLVLNQTNVTMIQDHDSLLQLHLRDIPLNHKIQRYHYRQVSLIVTGTLLRSVQQITLLVLQLQEYQASQLARQQPIPINLRDFLQAYQSALFLKFAVKAALMLLRSFLTQVSKAIIVEAGDKRRARPVGR